MPGEEGFDSNGGHFVASLRGPAGSDFDLYLDKYNRGALLGLGAGWRTVAASEREGADEDLVVDAGRGVYRWRVAAARGGGGYELRFNRPGP